MGNEQGKQTVLMVGEVVGEVTGLGDGGKLGEDEEDEEGLGSVAGLDSGLGVTGGGITGVGVGVGVDV